MIDVHHEVADLEVAEVREKRLRGGAAPFGRAALLLEDIGLGVDLQPGVGQPEAARQRADGHQERRVAGIVGALDGNGEHAMFLQQLDRAFRPPGRGRDEQRSVAVLAKPADLGHPILDAALELDRRLAAHVLQRQRLARTGRRRADRRVIVQSEFGELRRLGQPRLDGRGFDEQDFGGQDVCIRVARDCALVTLLDLLQELSDVRVHFVPLGHDHARAGCVREIVE